MRRVRATVRLEKGMKKDENCVGNEGMVHDGRVCTVENIRIFYGRRNLCLTLILKTFYKKLSFMAGIYYA